MQITDINEIAPTRINLLRHGEHALGEAICGVKDPQLSEKGWGQLTSQIDSLAGRGHQWDICVSSPRLRCAEFARHVSQQFNIELVIKDTLSELGFGEWEGLTGAQIESSFPGQWQQWLDNPDEPAPHGGEAYGLFQQRILKAWSQLISQYQGKHILLLSHSGVMRAILTNVLDLDTKGLFRFNVPHACHSQVSVYHLSGKPDWFQLEQHNSDCS
jgi:broad specificity phosphatase PhoE